MKIAVVGAGAMGSILGAGLAEAGHDVVLIDVVRSLVDKINGGGVTIVSKDGKERRVQVAATADCSVVGPTDLIFMMVKSYSTDAAARASTPLLGGGTVVTSLQNGLGNEEILARCLGPDRIVAGVTYFAGSVLEPGRVAYTDIGPTILGPFDGSSLQGARRVEKALASAGFEVHLSERVLCEIWKKLIVSAALAPPAALTGSDPAGPGPLLDLIDGLVREGVAVARATGCQIDAEERMALIHEILWRGSGSKGSMQLDFEENRKSEVDAITGAIIRAAAHSDVPVPLHRTMFALVKGHERTRGIA